MLGAPGLGWGDGAGWLSEGAWCPPPASRLHPAQAGWHPAGMPVHRGHQPRGRDAAAPRAGTEPPGILGAPHCRSQAWPLWAGAGPGFRSALVSTCVGVLMGMRWAVFRRGDGSGWDSRGSLAGLVDSGPRAPGFRAWQGPEVVPGAGGGGQRPRPGVGVGQGTSGREKQGQGQRLPPTPPTPISGPCSPLKLWALQVQGGGGWGWTTRRTSATFPPAPEPHTLLSGTRAGLPPRAGLWDPLAFPSVFAFSHQLHSGLLPGPGSCAAAQVGGPVRPGEGRMVYRPSPHWGALGLGGVSAAWAAGAEAQTGPPRPRPHHSGGPTALPGLLV